MEAEELDCHMDLLSTSNNRDVVFIDQDDRRTEIIDINPELKAIPGDKKSTQFWHELNKEFKDVNIVAAWFQYLANRDIKGVVFNEDYRFSRDTLQEVALDNLVNSHQFMVDYFCRSDCIFNNSLRNHATDFFSYAEFKLYKGERTMVIKAQKLYKILYKDVYCIESGNKIRKKERTFVKDMAAIGLKTRLQIHGSPETPAVIRFSKKTLVEGLVHKYTHIKQICLDGFFMDNDKQWNKLKLHQFPQFGESLSDFGV